MLPRAEQLLAAMILLRGAVTSPIANPVELQPAQLAKREEGFIFVDCGNYSAANVSGPLDPTSNSPRWHTSIPRLVFSHTIKLSSFS